MLNKPIQIFPVLIFIGLSLSCTGQKNIDTNNNPYLNLKNDSVVIYDYNEFAKGTDPYTPIVKNGILSSSVKKSSKLNKDSALKFTKMLGDTNSFGQPEASCFEPHLGVVYWYKGKPVGFINICMDCNVIEPNMNLRALLVRKRQSINSIRSGMSKSFRKFIRVLLAEYEFSHQPAGNDTFDN